MKEAENISMNYGAQKIAVISGVGVREYYSKLGYHLENNYMVKEIISQQKRCIVFEITIIVTIIGILISIFIDIYL